MLTFYSQVMKNAPGSARTFSLIKTPMGSDRVVEVYLGMGPPGFPSRDLQQSTGVEKNHDSILGSAILIKGASPKKVFGRWFSLLGLLCYC